MEREEYNRDTNPYPSFGKKYNSECAIISLTSWTARINTVSKTLYSLLTQCPGFHIVLVLSEEEFPKMTAELPENLMLFVDNELIELMFVRKNYKSFKKVIFSMDKYRDVPVISADDDCIYTCNYAKELYEVLNKHNKKCIVRYTTRKGFFTQGPCTLYNVSAIDINYLLLKLKNRTDFRYDDDFYSKELNNLKYEIFSTNKTEHDFPFKFHDDIQPLTKNQRNVPWYKHCFE